MHNLYICMTKPYKATQFWVDMYDKRHTLFNTQIYKKVITNHQTDF
jgi:hypothetical protein